MPVALGWGDSSGFSSTTKGFTPWWRNSTASISPTDPPPAIKTSVDTVFPFMGTLYPLL